MQGLQITSPAQDGSAHTQIILAICCRKRWRHILHISLFIELQWITKVLYGHQQKSNKVSGSNFQKPKTITKSWWILLLVYLFKIFIMSGFQVALRETETQRERKITHTPQTAITDWHVGTESAVAPFPPCLSSFQADCAWVTPQN